MNTKGFDKKNKNEENYIIIYGASVWGEIAYYGLKKMGLRPDFFCDQSEKRKSYLSVRVISPDKLKEQYRDADIIIASADFFYEIKDMLEVMGCTNLYDMSELLKLELDEQNMSNRAKDMYINRQHYVDVVSNQGSGKIVMARLQYVVTERCTLRCKDCSYLMPYYHEAQDISISLYKDAFDLFLETVDYLAELRILGGEPVLSDEFHKLILRYADYKKIGKISVFTNGTLIPSGGQLETMKNKKVTVHISDYEINRKKIKLLTDILDEKKIKYFVRSYDEWQEAGGLERRNESESELVEKYSNCFERSGYTFLKGRVYLCPREAHALNLKGIPDLRMDYVDFTDKKTREKFREELLTLQGKRFLEGCRYCSGADNHSKGIPAGIQTNKPIEYEVID